MVRRRLLSMLSALALVLTLFTLLPEGALKAHAYMGSGTKDDPYLATNYYDLKNMLDTDYNEVYIKLAANIVERSFTDDYELRTYSNSKPCVYHLDLNGHFIERQASTTDRAIFEAGKNTTLIIDDSAGGGTVRDLLSPGGDGIAEFTYMFYAYGGKLIINGGTYTQTDLRKGLFWSVDTPIEINGGSFSTANEFFNSKPTHASIFIYGGTFRYTDNYRDGGFSLKYSTQQLKIYNATFISDIEDFCIENDYTPYSVIANRFSEYTKVVVDGSTKTREQLEKTKSLKGKRFVISTPLAAHATLSVTEPVHGAKPQAATVSSSLGIPLKDTLTTWYDIQENRELKSGETFISGRKYRLQSVIGVEDGYLFGAAPVISINNDPAIKPTVTKLNDYYCRIDAEFVCSDIPVYNVDVSLTEPVSGALVNETMTTSTTGVIICRGESSSSTQNRGYWYHGEKKMSAVDKFAAGETYTALFNLCPAENYKLAADLTVKVNGKDAKFIRNSGGYMTYEIDFTTAPAKITEVKLQAVMPKGGKTPEPLTVISGDVRVTTIWYHGTDKMAAGEKFVTGEKYTMYCMVSRLNSNQTFSQYLYVYVNGGHMQINKIYDSYVLCQRTVTAAAGETYQTGDVNHDGSVDRIDANLLSRYVAGWDGYEEKIFKDCADLNDDHEINRIDANILSRCVADWDGYRAQYIK